MSSQGGVGELSGASAAPGGIKCGEMEVGPAQGEGLMVAAGEGEEPLSAHLSRKSAIINQFESKALGLDKAILHSIDCCGKKEECAEQNDVTSSHIVLFSRECGLFHPEFFLTASDETKRKMYSSILVVGGGLMFHGAQEFLLHRIINKMPPSFRRLVDNVEIITRPKVTKHTHTVL